MWGRLGPHVSKGAAVLRARKTKGKGRLGVVRGKKPRKLAEISPKRAALALSDSYPVLWIPESVGHMSRVRLSVNAAVAGVRSYHP
eukprot:scaffold37818_cov64-Phaeocystis_antarctica.AAC.1